MKKLTSIQIKNFRAFFGDYELIVLSNGENLLVYGENGSGKSSLFKALSNFFTSSRQTGFSYIKNHHQNTLPGHLNFTFNEYNPLTSQITSQIGQVITFGSDISTTDSANFVKDTELTKGFLDYRSLLDVYNHKEEKPNLFNLIVTELLLNYIPPGGTYSFGTKWKQLEINLRDVYNRNEVLHKRALADLPAYETALRTALDRIFLQLNGLLIKYFKLNLRVWYNLLPLLPYNYDLKNWHATKDFRLDLKLNGVKIENQSDYLNEARLSALSICLYLAALLRNPQVLDYKILFLDDVFIGLDAGNRIPILNILQNEFKNYQIFISTYDRHWFELAKRHFEIEVPGKWLTTEFYVGKESIAKNEFSKPIIVKGEGNFEKAVQYLHNRSKPDYPAAANYFRKSLEELIQLYIPKWELADLENSTQLPEYMLSPLIYRAKRFIEKTENSSEIINKVIGLLPTVLHPLSHHEITSPIYKGELTIIENLIPKLIVQLRAIDALNNYKCSAMTGRNKVRIKFVIDAATGHFSFYDLRTTEPLVLKLNPVGTPLVMKINSVAEKVWGENNGAPVAGSRKEFSNEEKEQPGLNFASLQDAYDRLHARMILIPAIGNFAKEPNYIDAFYFFDNEGNFQPLNSIIV